MFLLRPPRPPHNDLSKCCDGDAMQIPNFKQFSPSNSAPVKCHPGQPPPGLVLLPAANDDNISHYLKTRHISEDITDVSTSTIFIPRLQQPQSREYSTVAVTASDVMMTRTTDNLTYTLSLFFYKTVYIQ